MVKAFDQDVPEDTTKQKILEAASQLIAELGWPDVTTRSIAERAGVNNALIHYYFGTKDALLLEAATVMFSEEFSGPMTGILAAPTFREGLQAYLDYLRVIEDHGPGVVVSVEALLRGVRDPAVAGWIRDLLSGARQLLEQVVVAAQERGELPAELDPAGTAVVLAALLDGLILYRLVFPDINLDGVESSILTLLNPKGTR